MWDWWHHTSHFGRWRRPVKKQITWFVNVNIENVNCVLILIYDVYLALAKNQLCFLHIGLVTKDKILEEDLDKVILLRSFLKFEFQKKFYRTSKSRKIKQKKMRMSDIWRRKKWRCFPRLKLVTMPNRKRTRKIGIIKSTFCVRGLKKNQQKFFKLLKVFVVRNNTFDRWLALKWEFR